MCVLDHRLDAYIAPQVRRYWHICFAANWAKGFSNALWHLFKDIFLDQLNNYLHAQRRFYGQRHVKQTNEIDRESERVRECVRESLEPKTELFLWQLFRNPTGDMFACLVC